MRQQAINSAIPDLCHWSMSRSHIKLTHWGRVTHICVDKLTIIGSDNGLSPGRRQPIIWTNAGILLIEPLGTNFSEISIGIQILSFKKMRWKMSSAKWRPFCLGLNVLTSSSWFPGKQYQTRCGAENKTSLQFWRKKKTLPHVFLQSFAFSIECGF